MHLLWQYLYWFCVGTTRKKGVTKQKSYYWAMGLFLCYSGCVFFITLLIHLLPALHYGTAHHNPVNWVPLKGIIEMATTQNPDIGYSVFARNVIGNIILFVPLGVFLPILKEKEVRLKTIAVIGFVASFAIEFTQYFIGGQTDIDDLLLNTLGTVTGYFIYKGCKQVFKKKSEAVASERVQ